MGLATGARDVSAEIRNIADGRGIPLPYHRAWISLAQYQKSYDLAQRYLKPGAQVLDWGAGNGHFGLFLLKCGFRPEGFAIREPGSYRAFINAINDRYGDRYQTRLGDPVANRIHIPYEQGTFDGVFSIGVLEHVREFGGDELGSMRELHRILKPGGIFVCTHFPNRWSWVEKIRGRHKFKYSLSDIRRLAKEAKFELLELGRYQFLPRVILNLLPESIGNSALAVNAYNAVDAALSWLLNPLCTCNYFVCRKPE